LRRWSRKQNPSLTDGGCHQGDPRLAVIIPGKIAAEVVVTVS